ncbi:YqjF family protein [Kitasatospora sp. A2-31]|uniref:YqjF family protein n=1 Tax=Kitasatospora sp. A2-31 TaxID=2916414 RepID=UPI001EEC518F|nr:DUF2071 domain-containing protein [Kitasatospora sp. A2-31]MCG6494307.1 DUF2071 domain-containing protein [Kitasatospora sp. A2-31]
MSPGCGHRGRRRRRIRPAERRSGPAPRKGAALALRRGPGRPQPAAPGGAERGFGRRPGLGRRLLPRRPPGVAASSPTGAATPRRSEGGATARGGGRRGQTRRHDDALPRPADRLPRPEHAVAGHGVRPLGLPTGRHPAAAPPGLTVDRYAERAWVGLTPFTMAKVRTAGRLPFPGETFPETNLRTYVRGPRGRDGLWFFSLDTTHLLLTVAANALLGAPYRPARLEAAETEARDGTGPAGGRMVYRGRRAGGRATYRLALRPGPALVPSDLEIWLTSRWRAYTRHLGLLWETPVEHEPWPLRSTTDVRVVQDVTAAAGLHQPANPPLVHFSDGVRRVRLGVTRPAG